MSASVDVLANAANWRIEIRSGERCIVDEEGTIAVVFGDDPAEANAILRAVQQQDAVAELVAAAQDQNAAAQATASYLGDSWYLGDETDILQNPGGWSALAGPFDTGEYAVRYLHQWRHNAAVRMDAALARVGGGK